MIEPALTSDSMGSFRGLASKISLLERAPRYRGTAFPIVEGDHTGERLPSGATRFTGNGSPVDCGVWYRSVGFLSGPVVNTSVQGVFVAGNTFPSVQAWASVIDADDYTLIAATNVTEGQTFEASSDLLSLLVGQVIDLEIRVEMFGAGNLECELRLETNPTVRNQR